MGAEVCIDCRTLLIGALVLVAAVVIAMRWMWVRRQNAYHDLVNEIHKLATKVDSNVQDARGEVDAQRAYGLASGLRFAAMMIRHRQFGGPKPELYGDGWGNG